MRPHSMIRLVVALTGVVFGAILLSACGSSQAEWVLTEDPDGEVLQIEFVIGNGCWFLDRIDVDENAFTVKISAWVERRGSDCEGLEKIERHEVRLAAPLGTRELLGCDLPGRNQLRGPGLVDCQSVQNSGTAWRLQESPEGRTLKLVALTRGSCNSIDRVVVEETEEAVGVRVYTRHIVSSSSEEGGQTVEECTADEREVERTAVELEEPLGDRALAGCVHYVDLQNLDPATAVDCTKMIWRESPPRTD